MVTEYDKCPEYDRQKRIKEVMPEKNISYSDAIKLFPKNTYASAVKSNNGTNSLVNTNNSQNVVSLANSFNALTNLTYNPENFINNSQSTSKQNKYTIHKTPAKLVRPSSPNPLLTEQNEIIKPINHDLSGGILSQSSYKKNMGGIRTEFDEDIVDSLVHINTDVIRSLNNNHFLFLKSDLLNIVKDRLRCELEVNSGS